MSALFNVLVIVAVVALVVARQFTAAADRRPTSGGGSCRRSCRSFALRDSRACSTRTTRHCPSLMLGAGLVVGLVTGAGWGWTSPAVARTGRLRVEQGHQGHRPASGRQDRAACRARGYRLAARHPPGHRRAHVALAATLLVRGGVLDLRARSVRRRHRRGPAYGAPHGRTRRVEGPRVTAAPGRAGPPGRPSPERARTRARGPLAARVDRWCSSASCWAHVHRQASSLLWQVRWPGAGGDRAAAVVALRPSSGPPWRTVCGPPWGCWCC